MGESRSVRDALEDAAQVVEQMLWRAADKDPISIAGSSDNPGRANAQLAIKIRRVLHLRPMPEYGHGRKWHLGKLFTPGKVPAKRLEVAVGVHCVPPRPCSSPLLSRAASPGRPLHGGTETRRNA